VGWVEPHRENLTNAEAPPAARPTIPSAAPSLNWEAPGSFPTFSPELLDLPKDQQSALLEAADWILEQLAAGPRPARELLGAAAEAGITRTTLYSAKRELKVRSHKATIDQPWYWGLGQDWSAPRQSLDAEPGVHTKAASSVSSAH
jgi:hypothetical protein